MCFGEKFILKERRSLPVILLHDGNGDLNSPAAAFRPYLAIKNKKGLTGVNLGRPFFLPHDSTPHAAHLFSFVIPNEGRGAWGEGRGTRDEGRGAWDEGRGAWGVGRVKFSPSPSLSLSLSPIQYNFFLLEFFLCRIHHPQNVNSVFLRA